MMSSDCQRFYKGCQLPLMRLKFWAEFVFGPNLSLVRIWHLVRIVASLKTASSNNGKKTFYPEAFASDTFRGQPHHQIKTLSEERKQEKKCGNKRQGTCCKTK